MVEKELNNGKIKIPHKVVGSVMKIFHLIH